MLPILVGLGACTTPPAGSSRDPAHPDLRLNQVSIRSWSGDQLKVVTTANRLDVFREVGTPGEVVAFDAGVTLVSDGTQLSAPVVTGNLFSGQFEGAGGVNLFGPNELRARSPRVGFNRGHVWSDAGVVLTRPGMRQEASEFEYDVAEEHATFIKPQTTYYSQTPSPQNGERGN